MEFMPVCFFCFFECTFFFINDVRDSITWWASLSLSFYLLSLFKCKTTHTHTKKHCLGKFTRFFYKFIPVSTKQKIILKEENNKKKCQENSIIMMRPPSVMYRLYQESISFFFKKKKLFKDEHTQNCWNRKFTYPPTVQKCVFVVCLCVCAYRMTCFCVCLLLYLNFQVCSFFFFNLSHTHTEPKPRTAPLSSLTVMKTPSFFLMLFFFHSPQLFFLNPPV